MVIGALALAFLVKQQRISNYIGLVFGMVIYVAFVAILSKFGYQRQSMQQARERRRAAVATPAAATQTGRQRPAPPRRTTAGPSQRPNRSTKKRRR